MDIEHEAKLNALDDDTLLNDSDVAIKHKSEVASVMAKVKKLMSTPNGIKQWYTNNAMMIPEYDSSFANLSDDEMLSTIKKSYVSSMRRRNSPLLHRCVIGKQIAIYKNKCYSIDESWIRKLRETGILQHNAHAFSKYAKICDEFPAMKYTKIPFEQIKRSLPEINDYLQNLADNDEIKFWKTIPVETVDEMVVDISETVDPDTLPKKRKLEESEADEPLLKKARIDEALTKKKNGSKCEHDKPKYYCKICSDCGHGKVKYNCNICNDCGHGKVKSNCGKCNDCGHGNAKGHCNTCNDCGHGKVKYNCNICSGCDHGNVKHVCPICKKVEPSD
jgi:hypothetical protein